MFESALQRDKQFNQAYMRMAETFATLSRSNKRKVGALIVKGRNIVAYGFNGTVTGMTNACEDANNKTYPYVIHADECHNKSRHTCARRRYVHHAFPVQ